MHAHDGFRAALVAPGPHPSLGAHAETYGRLIGGWTGERRAHRPDGAISSVAVEIDFAWVLGGRAVQDVWITAGHELFGTTLRVFDAKRETWRVLWWNPASGSRSELEGRRQGDDVVQLGASDGRPIRWTFSRIRPRSFAWHGHALADDGVTWQLESEFELSRR